MSNVVTLSFPKSLKTPAEQVAALGQCFASGRRHQDDVFWLKENAEFLNILETSAHPNAGEALQPYAPVYETLAERMAFFPQYYRFHLSLCLDLEDIGMPGDQGAALCGQVARSGLVETELSDLQRAEARRLLLRRGERVPRGDDGLDDRLRAFIALGEPFAVPNKKMAYELTHIVFYLSEYGRRDPALPAEAIDSLMFAGLLAMLEDNADLLAEICIALRFAGQIPPEAWSERVSQQAGRFTVLTDEAGLADDYHAYLMAHWHGFLTGGCSFAGALAEGRMVFAAPLEPGRTPLRELSEALYDMGAARSPSWARMAPALSRRLSPTAWQVLTEAAGLTDGFARFFRAFARAATEPCAMLRAL